MTRRVAVLGSTGSIGTQTLDIVRSANAAAAEAGDAPAYEVTAIGASGRRPELLASQAAEFEVPLVAIGDPDTAAAAADALGGVEVVTGDEGAEAACAHADVVINGIVGFFSVATARLSQH